MAEKTETVYTENVVAAMRDAAPLNWEKAQEIAERFDLKAKGVVSSAIRNGIEYKRKDLVDSIAKKLGVDSLDGLEKSTKTALEIVLSNL